jgi:hypothetical protein
VETNLLGNLTSYHELFDDILEIDGPNGERITGFESLYYSGELTTFRVSLNTLPRRRMCEPRL